MAISVVQRAHFDRCRGLIMNIWGWNEAPLEQMKFHAPGIFGKREVTFSWPDVKPVPQTKKVKEDIAEVTQAVADRYNDIAPHLPNGDFLRVYLLMGVVHTLFDDCGYIYPEVMKDPDFKGDEAIVDRIMDWLFNKLTDVEGLISTNNMVKMLDAVYSTQTKQDGASMRWLNGVWYTDADKYSAAIHAALEAAGENK
jgi:hypothetical protein